MGYACPVCETPHADGEHLANHLGLTAVLHEADHESWLDTHVADWESKTPEALADHVTEHAEEIEFELVFDDTTPANATSPDPRVQRSTTSPPHDPVTQQILEEARALTKHQNNESQNE